MSLLKPRNPTSFALDFDNTISNDPIMWGKLIGIIRDFGHDIIIVTGRCSTWDNYDIVEFCKQYDIGVIFTECQAKKEFVKSIGCPIDVWIDDNPNSIVTDWCPDAREITKCYVCEKE